MAWWRAYDEALDDPKLQRLGPAMVGVWFNLMCLASRNAGVLPSTDDVVFALRTTPEDFGPKFKALADAGLFDKTERGWEPHNWNGRQYKSDVSTERVKRFRERHETVSETPSESEQTQSRAEQRVGARARKTRIPDDFSLTDERAAYAKAQGCADPAETFSRFELHHASKGTLMADWDKAWQYWCRNEKNFTRPAPAKSSFTAPQTIDRDSPDQWRGRIRGWKPGKFWHRSDWGPEPGQPGCRVPSAILSEWESSTKAQMEAAA